MAYGITVKNSNGYEIISANYRGYGVISTGTLANNAGLPTLTSGQLLLVRPTGTDASGASIKADFMSPGQTPTFTSSTGYWEYTIVSSLPAASPESYGLRVLNASGQVTFDSGRKQMMPQGSIAVYHDASYNYWLPATFTVPAVGLAGRRRWVLFGVTQAGFLDIGNPNATEMAVPLIKFISNTSVSLESAASQLYGPALPDGGSIVFNAKMQVHLVEV